MKNFLLIGLTDKDNVNKFADYMHVKSEEFHFKFDKYLYSKNDFLLYDKLGRGFNPLDYDAVVSVGGDGTFLFTSRVFAGTDVPVFGVNSSRLGFNTRIELSEIESYLRSFMQDKSKFEYKDLLDISIDGEPQKYTVLNEGVISHTGISRMIRLNVFLNDDPIYDFRGDGLIISTSTGSTAYNLSAGGPILHPSVDAIALSPICPHTLAIRPYILPNDRCVNIIVKESTTQPQLTLDGQKIILLNVNQNISFKKSEKTVKIVKSDKSFSYILKDKLGWTV